MNYSLIKIRKIISFLFVVVCMFPVNANAHQNSDSYLQLVRNADEITGLWKISIRDLQYHIGVDSNADGAVTWGEIRHQRSNIIASLLPYLAIRRGNDLCKRRQVNTVSVEVLNSGMYLVVPINAHCESAGDISIEYGLFWERDPLHRGLLNYSSDRRSFKHIFAPVSPVFKEQGATSSWLHALSFVREGIWHIWIGYDHILFLLALLAPAALRRHANGWMPIESFSALVKDIFVVVTAFTAAHSITLTIAAMRWLDLSVVFVETAIAVSVIIAGLNIIFPWMHRKRWWLGFGFGLIHGFGFAGVLIDLGLPHAGLVTALLSFNIGVELGQMAIVSVFLPVLYMLRTSPIYARYALPLTALLIIIVGAVWTVDRGLSGWQLV